VLLQVEKLQTHLRTPTTLIRAVEGVSFDLPAGQTLALVGESGCGKTLTALSILRLLPPTGRIAGGSIRLNGRNLLELSTRELRQIRGRQIAMVFQEPLSSLNPLLTIGQQIAEALPPECRRSRPATRDAVTELLQQVGIPGPRQRLDYYPHQLSGGMRQRVMIAMALAGRPQLLIADEPTTALDMTTQAQIADLLLDLRQQAGLAMLLISHGLGLVARLADLVCVMYAGRVVEHASPANLFADPRHPYTRGLLRCASGWLDPAAQRRLLVIPGQVPGPHDRPAGCPFHPCCELGRDDPLCQARQPPLLPVASAHACACWKAPGYPPDPDAVGVVSHPPAAYNDLS